MRRWRDNGEVQAAMARALQMWARNDESHGWLLRTDVVNEWASIVARFVRDESLAAKLLAPLSNLTHGHRTRASGDAAAVASGLFKTLFAQVRSCFRPLVAFALAVIALALHDRMCACAKGERRCQGRAREGDPGGSHCARPGQPLSRR